MKKRVELFSPNTHYDTKVLFQETLNVKENENLGTYLGMAICSLLLRKLEGSLQMGSPNFSLEQGD